MIYDVIKKLREDAGYSQAELARKSDVTQSSINAWEMGLSTPATPYIVELAKLFHVSVDCILGLKFDRTISIGNYSQEEIKLIYNLIKYIDKNN